MINQTLKSYVNKNLKPTQNENEEITKHYKIIQDILGYKETFRSGSYARLTSTSPVNDLDVIYVLPEKYLSDIKRKGILQRANESFSLLQKAKIDHNDLDIKNIISSLASEIKQKYFEIGVFVSIKEQSHSIGIYFHFLPNGEPDMKKFSLDIVPAIQDGQDKDGNEMYLVPEITLIEKPKRSLFVDNRLKNNQEIEWIKSNPRGYKKQSEELRAKYPDLYRFSVILIKAWKNGCKSIDEENFCLKSFHLEQIIAEEIKNLEDKTIFNILELALDKLPQYMQEPILKDKAENGRFIDSYVESITKTQQEFILECIKKAKSDLISLASGSDFEKNIQIFLNLETFFTNTKVFNNSIIRNPKPRYSTICKDHLF